MLGSQKKRLYVYTIKQQKTHTMTHLTKQTKEKLNLLNGCEIRSIWNYEGTVLVKGSNVYQDGEKVDTLNTKEKICSLFNEYFQNEFGENYF